MKSILSFLLLAAVAASLTACGAGGASTKINVEMTDFAFTPNQFTVPAGEEIVVNAAHHGVTTHEFIIMKAGTDAGEKFDETDRDNVYLSVEVPPDHAHSFTFVSPSEPGVYQIVCGIPGHMQAGMVGTLTVVASQ
jgi:uncharacterized cupredoxin-like copper-binding protein